MPDPEPVDLTISMTIANLKKRAAKYKRERDTYARHLARILDEMELDGYTFNEELTAWRKAHKKK